MLRSEVGRTGSGRSPCPGTCSAWPTATSAWPSSAPGSCLARSRAPGARTSTTA